MGPRNPRGAGLAALAGSDSVRGMSPKLRKAFAREMSQASSCLASGDPDGAFRHLERAHVLGQAFVIPHVRSHLGMLRVGVARRDLREIFGQLLRVVAGAVGSALGVVPAGNTGGSNVSAFEPMDLCSSWSAA